VRPLSDTAVPHFTPLSPALDLDRRNLQRMTQTEDMGFGTVEQQDARCRPGFTSCPGRAGRPGAVGT
jgi:hypothetical protein